VSLPGLLPAFFMATETTPRALRSLPWALRPAAMITPHPSSHGEGDRMLIP
jgi:hypothetical protein